MSHHLIPSSPIYIPPSAISTTHIHTPKIQIKQNRDRYKMKIKNWLSQNKSATSSAVNGGATPSHYNPSSSSSPSYSTPSSTVSSSSSLQSNFSLQTLPSVPSLQTTLSPQSSLQLSITHTLISSIHYHTHTISSLAVSHQHRLLYAASGNQIAVYDLETLALVDSFNANDPSSGSVKSITFCRGNVISSHQNGKIKVWKIQKKQSNDKHKLVTTLPTVNDKLRRLISPGSYVQVRRHKKRMWIEHNDAVSGLAVADSELNLMCSVSWDKSLKIWRQSDFKCQQSIPAHEDAVNAVVLSKNGTVYTGCADGRIRVWTRPDKSVKKYTLSATLVKHKSAVNALALSADGGTLYSGACDRSILVWEREDSSSYMAVSGALRGHEKAILCLVNHGDMLMSGSADRTVRIWAKGSDGRFCCLAVLDGHRSAVKSIVAVSGSGGSVSVYSGGLDGEIRVWEINVLDFVKDSYSKLLFDER